MTRTKKQKKGKKSGSGSARGLLPRSKGNGNVVGVPKGAR